jgi:steroid delta-isomerase-like uncharacterized protein
MPNHPDTELLVQQYADAIGSGDLDRVWSFYADDIVYEDTAVKQVHRGLEAVKKFYVMGMGALDVKWDVDTIVCTDSAFGLAWQMTGRHIHDLPGMPATGRPFTVPGSSIGEVRDGKIARNRDFWNNYDLLKQLGIR